MRKQFSKLALMVAFGLAMIFTFSCSIDDGNGDKSSSSSGGGGGGSSSSTGGGTSGDFLDSRDSKSYKWVKIGTQIWMAENLNYKTADGKSRCYPISGTTNTSDADNANCDTYGRLYNWKTAMDGAASSNTNPSGVTGICPNGWHIPSDAEWDVLVNSAGGSSIAGGKLKAANGWNDGGNGTNDYGFAALPSGDIIVGEFGHIGAKSCWWSSLSSSSWNTYFRCVELNSTISQSKNYENYGHSVRCVYDSPNPPSSDSPSTGACILNMNGENDDDPFEYCVDVNRNICEQVHSGTFRTGECSPTEYPCCLMEEDGWNAEYLGKNECYSRGGKLANEIVCIGY